MAGCIQIYSFAVHTGQPQIEGAGIWVSVFRQQQRGEGQEHHQARNTSLHPVGCALPVVIHTDLVGEGRKGLSLREHAV